MKKSSYPFENTAGRQSMYAAQPQAGHLKITRTMSVATANNNASREKDANAQDAGIGPDEKQDLKKQED